LSTIKKIKNSFNAILVSTDPDFILSFINAIISGLSGVYGMVRGDLSAANDLLESAKEACKMGNIRKAQSELKKLEALFNRVSSNVQIEIAKVIPS